MNHFVRWAVRNGPTMNTLMAAILVVGIGAATALRRESFPEFQLEFIYVTVPYPGASPEEVEEGICLKIEEAIRSIQGIKKITSVAAENAGSVVAELFADVDDPQRVLNDVRSEIDRIPSFPALAEDAEVKQVLLRSPAINVAVVGDAASDGPDAEWELRALTERIRDELLQLPSVAQVELMAGKEFQIDVEIPEARLREYGLSLTEVAALVRRENMEMPAGKMPTPAGDYLVRGKNKRKLGVEIARLPLVTDPDGAVVTIGDVATVRDGFEDVTTISRIDGKPGLVLAVQKTETDDLIRIAEEVRDYVDQRPMPANYRLRIFDDRSLMVEDRLDLLLRNGFAGLVLVFLVLATFLEMKLAFWVALGIPISVLGSCAVMLSAGATINMISMFAFLLGLGIVVDDAIVVGENIHSHRETGKPPEEAAIDGTVEVAPSVTASVATTIIAFLPLFFVSGVMGKFIAVMPLAVVAMLAFSLFESLLILPCHLAHEEAGPLARRLLWLFSVPLFPLRLIGWFFAYLRPRVERGLRFVIERAYVPMLRFSIAEPAIVISASIAFLLGALGLVLGGFTPFVIFPKLDANQVTARISFPDGTPAKITDAATRRLEEAIREVDRELRDQGQPILQLAYRSVGHVRDEQQLSDGRGAHIGQVTLELVDTEQRKITSDQILAAWRARAGEFPGVEELAFASAAVGPGGKPIEFKLIGADIEPLERAVEQVKERLRGYPGVVDVSDDSRPGKWELQLKIKPEAEAMGIDLADLAETVRATYYGAEVMRLQRGRHEVKLMVRYPKSERRSMANFEEIRVRTPAGDEVPLPVLAQVDLGRGYSKINRVDQRRSITVTADIDENVANARDITRDLQENYLPELHRDYPQVGVRWEGQQETTQESINSLFVGFAVAALVMYALLTAEFRSYVQPLLVLMIIPFGAVGAILGHLAMDLPLTMFSLFGLVALSGVVVNDSIVLLDFINHRLEDGRDVDAALLEAGQRRFRAVMLTSITTIAGLLPILMESSFQAQVLIPMAVSLAFGLSLSTVWVLLLVPAVFRVYAYIAFPDPRPAPADHDPGSTMFPAPAHDSR